MSERRIIKHQRCIGYQKMPNGRFGSVIKSEWSDGIIDYYISFEDQDGHFVTTPPTTTRPRIDIKQEEAGS